MTRSSYPALATGQVAQEGCFVSTGLSPAHAARFAGTAGDDRPPYTRTPTASIDSNALISEANQSMLYRGVRMLFVTDDTRQVRGVITATDILGERPCRRRNVRPEAAKKNCASPRS